MVERAYGMGLTNEWSEEEQRLSSAEEQFDPITFRNLDRLAIAEGMRCLEVGGGRGSVAAFMSDRVGASGSVVVTDLDLGLLTGCDRPNISAQIHDIRTDPLDQAAFDILHARLVLEHFPDRLSVLDKLVTALRPGGWMLIEDFDMSALLHLAPSKLLSVPERLVEVWQALIQGCIDLAGAQIDMEFGRDLGRHLVNAGLKDVGAEACTQLIHGGSSHAAFWRLGAIQTCSAVVAAGLVPQSDLDFFVRTSEDPRSMIQGPALVSAWGRRPLLA